VPPSAAVVAEVSSVGSLGLCWVRASKIGPVAVAYSCLIQPDLSVRRDLKGDLVGD